MLELEGCNLPEMAVDCWKIWAICGSMEIMLLPSWATRWFRRLTWALTQFWKFCPMMVWTTLAR